MECGYINYFDTKIKILAIFDENKTLEAMRFAKVNEKKKSKPIPGSMVKRNFDILLKKYISPSPFFPSTCSVTIVFPKDIVDFSFERNEYESYLSQIKIEKRVFPSNMPMLLEALDEFLESNKETVNENDIVMFLSRQFPSLTKEPKKESPEEKLTKEPTKEELKKEKLKPEEEKEELRKLIKTKTELILDSEVLSWKESSELIKKEKFTLSELTRGGSSPYALNLALSMNEKLNFILENIPPRKEKKKVKTVMKPDRKAIDKEIFKLLMQGAGDNNDQKKEVAKIQLKIISTLLYYLGLRINEIRFLPEEKLTDLMKTRKISILHEKTSTKLTHVISTEGQNALL